ncbi:MAG: sugar ABC transporter permease, partial [Fimbriimonadaceae bacterium]|nr:sugar ABC transporter permease [Fimbriimonadaceae bacterium]
LATLLQGVAPPGQQVNWLGSEKTALASLIIMSVWGAGGGMVILLAGLQSIPEQYYEAATLDGAGPWRKLKAVTLPLLSPTLFFSLITGVIGALQVFVTAFVLTGDGPGNSTRFIMLHLYRNAFESLRMGYASALSWFLFVVILLVTALQMMAAKRFVHYEGEVKP